MRRVLFLVLPMLVACYTYASVDPAAVRPGMGVRARVSSAAAERLAPLLGTSDTRLLTGTLIENEPSGMIIEVPMTVQTEVGTSVETLHQRVSVPRRDLVELETRQLDRLRTGALVGGAAIIVGSVVINSLKGRPGSETSPTPGSTDSRIPAARVP